jgi:hypothetical protein
MNPAVRRESGETQGERAIGATHAMPSVRYSSAGSAPTCRGPPRRRRRRRALPDRRAQSAFSGSVPQVLLFVYSDHLASGLTSRTASTRKPESERDPLPSRGGLPLSPRCWQRTGSELAAHDGPSRDPEGSRSALSESAPGEGRRSAAVMTGGAPAYRVMMRSMEAPSHVHEKREAICARRRRA